MGYPLSVDGYKSLSVLSTRVTKQTKDLALHRRGTRNFSFGVAAESAP